VQSLIRGGGGNDIGDTWCVVRQSIVLTRAGSESRDDGGKDGRRGGSGIRIVTRKG
jgi:hypothetical protein